MVTLTRLYQGDVILWHLPGHIDDIEKVQRRATKLLPDIAHLSYSSRLQELNLPTLVYRRLRGDMIETFKILHQIYDPRVSNFLPLHHYNNTRGHNYKLFVQPANSNIRKHYFSIRITEVWNHLPNIVVNAPSVQTFESRLDKCWSEISIKYDYRSQLNFSEFKALNITSNNIDGELGAEASTWPAQYKTCELYLWVI